MNHAWNTCTSGGRYRRGGLGRTGLAHGGLGRDGGTYDWSKDPGGRTFLKYAAAYGVEDLIGFVNSAPARWKTNGKSCGGHLAAAHDQDYGRYLADVVDHFARQGIRLDHISPMNEPTNSFAECGQEGMLVDVDRRDDIVRAVGAALDARGARTGVIADESSSTDAFTTEVPQWLAEPGTAKYTERLAHHTYNNPTDASRKRIAELAAETGIPSWSTEICCFGGGGTGWRQEYDPTIDNALSLSRIMHKDFTLAHDSAFHWWTALSNKMGADPETGATEKNDQGWNDGLIYYDPDHAANGNQELYLTKRYYALGQYSRFVRPGARLHDVTDAPDGVEITAFERRGTWTLVVNNHNATAADLDVGLPGGDVAARQAVRTSATENWARAARPALDGDRLTARLPARSITTYVLR